MDDSITTRIPHVTADAAAERVTAFLRTVYRWMFVGLGVTAAVAYAIDMPSPPLRNVAGVMPSCEGARSYSARLEP